MTDPDLRSIRITRTGPRTFVALNARGGRLTMGEGGDHFTPIELLLAATAGCSAMDVDYQVARRAEPESFEVTSSARKLHDEQGNHLSEFELSFRISFPDGPDGDRARAILERAVAQSRDRLCTVSRTVQLPTPVVYRIEDANLGIGEGPGEYESPGPS